jgi:hypothetical protein
MDAAAIHIENLGFTYPGQTTRCFFRLNLEISAGERFGLFGPRKNDIDALYDWTAYLSGRKHPAPWE